MLDAERFEQPLDRELVVGLARHRLAHQRGVSERVRRVAAGGARIEGQLRGAGVAGVAEDVFPRAVVGCAGRFGANSRGMIEKLFDGDAPLARVTQRLRPRQELESRIVERHLPRRPPLLAPLRGDGQHRRTHGLGHRRHAARVGPGTVAALDFEDDVAVADHHRGKVAIVGLQQPFPQLVQLRGIHACRLADVVRGLQLAPTPLRLRRREITALVAIRNQQSLRHRAARGDLAVEVRLAIHHADARAIGLRCHRRAEPGNQVGHHQQRR